LHVGFVALQKDDDIAPLHNLVGTCFMNSAVQLLSSAANVRRVLVSHLCSHSDMNKDVIFFIVNAVPVQLSDFNNNWNNNMSAVVTTTACQWRVLYYHY